jgi:hypothetical protein
MKKAVSSNAANRLFYQLRRGSLNGYATQLTRFWLP